MSSSNVVGIENKEQCSELQQKEQSELNSGKNLEPSKSIPESTRSFATLVKKEGTDNILEDSKVCSVNDTKMKVELVDSENFYKTVGTQCSGSSEDCIIVLKNVWSEGEEDGEDEQSDVKVGENEEDNIQVRFIINS